MRNIKNIGGCCQGRNHHEEHEGGCCGGHNHEHKQGGCGCGGHDHGHSHEHGEGCGCGGHDHGHDHEHTHSHDLTPVELTTEQREFLAELWEQGMLPVARYVAINSTNDDVAIVMLEPVFMRSVDDSMETVKEIGEFLVELEDLGLIAIMHGYKIQNYAYLEYTNASLYQFFCETVEQAKNLPNSITDTAAIEFGHIGITDKGQISLEN